MGKLIDNGDATKVPAMLAAADYLLQVTWLPDPESGPVQPAESPELVFSGTLRNMEHLAAAAAFAQSLLLGASSCGYKTYWSSGGALRKPQVFEWLGIPDNQILIGSIFLFPGETGTADVKPGAMAEKRGSLADWSKPVSIP